MAAPYKIPGVYIEEIPKFPPSIAPVETAIPAFIGYTQKATETSPDDLNNVPTKIGSLTEYELYFGEGAPVAVTGVTIDDSNNFVSSDISNTFYMYDSLRLFYANGGGDCYIVSVGTYTSANKVDADFSIPGDTSVGLGTLEKVDEPTILVFPDNSLLSDPHFNNVYTAALSQCAKLMDRVALMHVKEDDAQGANFRSGIGINNLKYGATYSPWLKASFLKNITFRDFQGVIKKGSASKSLADLTTDSDIQSKIAGYSQVITDAGTIDAATIAISTAATKTLRDKYNELESEYQGASSATKGAKMEELVSFLFDVARHVDVLVGGSALAGSEVGDADLKSDLQSLITSTLKNTYTTLISYDRELNDDVASYSQQYLTDFPTAAQWGDIFGASAPAASSVVSASTTADKLDEVAVLLPALFEDINSAWLGSVVDTVKQLEKSKHESLLETFPLYKTIIDGIQNTASTLPPSGAVAGIYAMVDRTRGVWKAPANVSVSNIIGPSETFTASELAALNVDANSGKSINAIRTFTGKGTLVYGARTLAGNDNEWRYISVRRFFNFVEESTKKATEQFVFEPNDANLWVRVQGMIENFLTYLWRQGALQGIKPEHAFYVAVGLGKTMTPIDILEGRMNVEIGMAVVRPAEFIILKFSHKMAES